MIDSRKLGKLQRDIDRYYRMIGALEKASGDLQTAHFQWEALQVERKSLNRERDRLVGAIFAFHSDYQGLHIRQVEWVNRVALQNIILPFLIDELLSVLKKHRSIRP